MTLQTDTDLEFLNRGVQGLLKRYGIHHFSTYNEETKANIVERVSRTLKTRMWRYVTKHETWRYKDILQNLVRSYNNRPHESIVMPAPHLIEPIQEEVWQDLYGGRRGKAVPKFRVDDRVRISKVKKLFEKCR